MRNIPFDQYQRYKNTQKVINNIRKPGEKFRILEVGANAHKNLERFLPEDEVTYLDITLPEELKNDPQYVLGDATQMSFDDDSFDIVIALDVYEHIPKNRRESFVGEIYRVAKRISIIAAPFNKPLVVEAEIRANQYYKTLSGENHIWLYEHIDYELPSLDEVKGFIHNKGIDYMHFSHGSLRVWEKLTNMHLATVVYNSLIDYKTEIDNYYNKFVFERDYNVNGYRDYFIFLKEDNSKLTIEYNNKCDNEIESLEKNFYNLLNVELINSKRLEVEKQITEENPIKLYKDNGEGFSEENSITKYIHNNRVEAIKFEDFDDRVVKALRFDPTEKPGKFEIENITIINSDNEAINELNVISNCNLKQGNVYYFGKDDPQILIEVNDKIKSVELRIKKIYDYNDDCDVNIEVINILNNIINQKNNEIQGLIEEQGALTKKIKQMKSKFFSK